MFFDLCLQFLQLYNLFDSMSIAQDRKKKWIFTHNMFSKLLRMNMFGEVSQRNLYKNVVFSKP